MANVLEQAVAIIEETTYGTKPSGAMRGYETRVDGFAIASEFIDGGGQRFGRRAQLDTRRRRVERGGSGSIETAILTTGHGLLLKHLLGRSVATETLAAVGGANPQKRVQTSNFTPTSTGPDKSYTITVARAPTVGDDPVYYDYLGCVPTGFSISVDNGSDLMLNVDYDFYLEQEIDTSNTANIPTINYQGSDSDFYIFEDCQLKIGTSVIKGVKSFELNVDLGMDTERYFLDHDALKDKPIRMSPPTASGTIEAEFQNTTEYNRFIAGAPFKLTLEAENSIIRTVNGPPKVEHHYDFILTMWAAQYDGSTPEMSTDGLGVISLPFTCLSTGSNWVDIRYKSDDTGF